MTEAEAKEAVALLDTRANFKMSPEEFGEVVDKDTWGVMVAAGRVYVDERLNDLGVTP